MPELVKIAGFPRQAEGPRSSSASASAALLKPEILLVEWRNSRLSPAGRREPSKERKGEKEETRKERRGRKKMEEEERRLGAAR